MNDDRHRFARSVSDAAGDGPAVAIVGMACRLPGADNPDEYWANLVVGVESIARTGGVRGADDDGAGRWIPAIGKVPYAEWFDADYFRVPPIEATTMDPQHRLLLELAVEALEDAGYGGARPGVVGVFAGSGESAYFHEHLSRDRALMRNAGDVRVALGNERDFLAPRIAFKLGLTGPSVTVQASCATSLTAVSLACSALLAGDCDLALAGGVSLLLPDVDGYEHVEGGIPSADGRCRAFARGASGPVPASGAGLVVLKRDRDAVADRDHRHAVIRGWAINNDGRARAGFTVPNVSGQEAVIRAALDRAGIDAAAVSYVEAHGTGTPLGDPVEVEALARVFAAADRPARSCAIGSVKTNIGHTDAAAGVAGLIKAARAVSTGVLPASLHFDEPNPAIDFDATPFYVNAATGPWPGPAGRPRIAGVSSFGLGGTNAHVIVEGVEPAAPRPAERPRQLLALSARTDADLRKLQLRLAEWLRSAEDATPEELADVAYTLAVGRRAWPVRFAGAFATAGEAAAALIAATDPAAPVSRWSLAVTGSSAELAALVRAVAVDPLLAGILEDTRAAAGDRAGDAEAAVAALAIVTALQRLGVTFARLSGPPGLRPALEWLRRGDPPEALPEALAACGPWDADERSGAAPPGTIAVGASFDLAGAAAQLWAGGTTLDWTAYFDPAARRRRPLPTYPFARRRFWIERPQPAADAVAAADAPGAPDPDGIAEYVALVWRDVLGLEEVDPDAHFVDDLEGDSMYAVEIGARLNERYGLRLPVDLPFIAPTVAQSAEYVADACAEGVPS